MKSKILGVVSALALSGQVSQASAAIVDITYTGTLYDAYSYSGSFGSGPLQGAFTATFSFDTSTTGLSEKVSGPFENYLQGGSFLGTNSPALSASITINGITETFVNPNLFGFIYGWNKGVNSSQIHQAAVAKDVFLYARIEAKNAALPATIDLPFTYTVQDGDIAQGSFQTAGASGKLNITSLTETVEEIPAVPEPAIWVMMMLGFGGLGCMAYRRKSTAMIHA